MSMRKLLLASAIAIGVNVAGFCDAPAQEAKTILGVIVLTNAGEIQGAKAIGAFASAPECKSVLRAFVDAHKDDLPSGVNVGVLCIDLSDDLKPTQKQEFVPPPEGDPRWLWNYNPRVTI